MSRVVGSDEAVAVITDGAVVAIGGSVNAGAPMHAVAAIIRSGVRDLTLVGGMTGTLALDFLIAAGCVSRIICPYVGNPEVSPVAPAFRFAAREGSLDIVETEEGVHLVALRAAASRSPFGVWRASVGTSIAELNPGVVLVEDDGPPYLRVAPLAIDVAVLWAPRGTAQGDVAWWRVSLGDIELAHAAAHRIVQVDSVTASARDLTGARHVSVSLADSVIEAPNGTAPFAGPDVDLDMELLRSYARSESLDECRRFVDERIRDVA